MALDVTNTGPGDLRSQFLRFRCMRLIDALPDVALAEATEVLARIEAFYSTPPMEEPPPHRERIRVVRSRVGGEIPLLLDDVAD